MGSESHYRRPDQVVCIGSQDQAKLAALFFDHVIPFLLSPFPSNILSPEFEVFVNKL